MSRTIRYIPLVAAVFMFAACSDRAASPTAPATPEIRRDGDGGLGVGGSAVGGPKDPNDPAVNTVQTAEADTTGRGGLGVGGS